jgi:hypothetical protein
MDGGLSIPGGLVMVDQVEIAEVSVSNMLSTKPAAR